jgi:uncharacterized protein
MKSTRIAGLDLANALALPGLFLTSFVLVLNNVFTKTSALEHDMIRDIWGCLFVFVSGMLVTITMHGARRKSRSKKRYFLRKGIVFLILGLGFSLIWPVNILILLGIMFIAAPFLAQLNSNILKSMMVLIFLGAVFVNQFGDVNLRPSRLSLDLVNPMTILNYLTNVVVSGYYALIPWGGFFMAGMIFARNDIMQRRIVKLNNIAGLAGLALGIIIHFIWIFLNPQANMSAAGTYLPFKLLWIIQTPAFIVIGTALSVLLVNFLIGIGATYKNSRILKFTATIGSMKQSLYLAHLCIGSFLIFGFNSNSYDSYEVASIITLFVTILLFVLAFLWKKQHNFGPVEWVIHRLSGNNDKS